MSAPHNNCRECLHFEGRPHGSKKGLCRDLGVKRTAQAPTQCFTPNVLAVTRNPDHFIQLAHMFASFDNTQRKVLISLLTSPKQAECPHPLGTKVFIRAFSGDYLSNYRSAYILCMSSDGYLLVTGSPEQNHRGGSFLGAMSPDTEMFTLAQWRTKRAQLISDGKINDPSMENMLPKIKDTDEVPTIDTPASDKPQKSKRKTAE